MAIEFMCRKIGMTQLFEDSGACVSVTVLEAAPNVVVQKKTGETDGYDAVLPLCDRGRHAMGVL